jgi:site-specific recombinase XerD
MIDQPLSCDVGLLAGALVGPMAVVLAYLVVLLHGTVWRSSGGLNTVVLMDKSTTKPFGGVAGQAPGNKGRKFPAEPLTPDEVAAIIGGCSPRARTGIRNRALLTLLYRSGLRISEALALKPSDIDLKRHTARVLHGKGDKATVRGFHPSATDALARWIDTRKSLGLRNGPLFCTLAGGPVYPQYVRLLLERLAGKAGVDKRVHPHGLRHTFADELRAAGVDVVTISKLLGHSSIAVTSRYLDHLTNHQAVEALAAVDLPDLDL